MPVAGDGKGEPQSQGSRLFQTNLKQVESQILELSVGFWAARRERRGNGSAASGEPGKSSTGVVLGWSCES